MPDAPCLPDSLRLASSRADHCVRFVWLHAFPAAREIVSFTVPYNCSPMRGRTRCSLAAVIRHRWLPRPRAMAQLTRIVVREHARVAANATAPPRAAAQRSGLRWQRSMPALCLAAKNNGTDCLHSTPTPCRPAATSNSRAVAPPVSGLRSPAAVVRQTKCIGRATLVQLQLTPDSGAAHAVTKEVPERTAAAGSTRAGPCDPMLSALRTAHPQVAYFAR